MKQVLFGNHDQVFNTSFSSTTGVEIRVNLIELKRTFMQKLGTWISSQVGNKGIASGLPES